MAVRGKKPCDFCRTHDCGLCPERIRDGAGTRGDWICPCGQDKHTHAVVSSRSSRPGRK